MLHSTEPVLVDTGTVAGAPALPSALASVIDPTELDLAHHLDLDHVGSCSAALARRSRRRE